MLEAGVSHPRTPVGYLGKDEDMSDKSFLDWPFFEPRHRDLAARLDDWCAAHLPVDHGDVDAACRGLVAMLGGTGGCDIPGRRRGSGWTCAPCA